MKSQADDAVKAGKRARDVIVEPIGTIPGVRLVSDVALERITWLWRHWLARGTVAFVEGDPGLGKSTLVVNIAARITRGDEMPDGTRGLDAPGHVLFILAEDTASTVRARLEAEGADLKHCWLMDFVLGDDGKPRGIVLPDDLPRIKQVIRAYGVVLVVFDPWFAFTSAAIDTHNDASSRLALTPAAKMAEATSCSVIALRHWNKGKGSAIQRGMGSTAHGAAARAVLTVGIDPADEARCVLAVVKTNLGPLPSSLGFSIAGTTERPDGTVIADPEGHAIETARVVWHGTNTARASDLVADSSDASERASGRAAEEFLRDALARGGRPAKEIKREADDAGIGWRTVERAKARLMVISCKRAFSGRWEWCLPADADDPTPPTPPLPLSDGGLRENGGVRTPPTPPTDPVAVFGGGLRDRRGEREGEESEDRQAAEGTRARARIAKLAPTVANTCAATLTLLKCEYAAAQREDRMPAGLSVASISAALGVSVALADDAVRFLCDREPPIAQESPDGAVWIDASGERAASRARTDADGER